MGSMRTSAAGGAAESDKDLRRAHGAELRGRLVHAPPRQALAVQDQPQLGGRHLNAPSLLRLVLSGDTIVQAGITSVGRTTKAYCSYHAQSASMADAEDLHDASP